MHQDTSRPVFSHHHMGLLPLQDTEAVLSSADERSPTGFAADPSVASLAVQHLQIRAFAAPAVMVLLVVNGAFRGFRDTK